MKDKELDLAAAQKIFGYFDKSQLINLFQLIFEAKETEVLNSYREIYNQGVEPKIFINDFLELLYYFKNIESLSIDSTNFSLNDVEFNRIKEISEKINNETLILFWQFTIKTLEELDIVSNQHLSIEMFLIKLMYLSGTKIDKQDDNKKFSASTTINEKENKSDVNKKSTIDQIKNTSQEKKLKLLAPAH